MPEVQCGILNDQGHAHPVQLGPTIPVCIGFDVNFRANSKNAPCLPEQIYPALIDTGATESCIDSDLAALLGLLIVDIVRMGGIDGSAEFNLHAAQVMIPSLKSFIYGRFAGVHLRAGGQPHQALPGAHSSRDSAWHMTERRVQ